MKSSILALSCVFLLTSPLFAADQTAALQAADDARVAAMKAADKAALTEIFSDDLKYAHSSGTEDSKASFIEVITTGKTKYVVFDYEKREFTFPAPGIALMSGRAHVQVSNASGGMDSVLSFLAVWKEEGGKWRFLAWQSARLAPPK